MLVTLVCATRSRIGRWRRTGLTLALELVQGLFRRERHDGELPVEFFLRQPLEAHTHALLRAEGDYAEAFRLAVRAVLEEFHLAEVRNANLLHRVRYILIRRPLREKLF